MERAIATAAYEHDEEAAPSPHASAIVRGESSGRTRLISDFETTACTTAEIANPRMSAQPISQVIAAASPNASATAFTTSGMSQGFARPIASMGARALTS